MNNNIGQIEEIYKKTLFAIRGVENDAKLRVEFYPYVKINNTIRLRNGVLHIKISDLLHDAPLEFQQALAEILIRKFYRKRVSSQLMQIFQDYVNQPELREKSITSRKERGRKILSGAQGEHYNLDKLFDLLNQKNFANSISKPVLTWSAHKTYRILGRYDPAHHTITISKTLDDEKVPPFVVMYVVYHEMLHIKHPTQYKNGRHSIHTPAFRREEESFELFESAEDWIEKKWGDFAKGKGEKGKRKKGAWRKLFNF
jgi:hypothetical protein